MPCFLVRGGGLRIAINLDQHESGGGVLLLRDIKPRNARLFHTLAPVGERVLFEGLNALGLHVNMDMNNQHTC